MGRASWLDKFCSETLLLLLIVDCEVLVETGVLPNCEQPLNEMEMNSRTLCYNMHLQRLKLHKQLL